MDESPSEAPTSPETDVEAPKRTGKRRHQQGWLGLVWTVVSAIAIAWFIQGFVVKPFKIPSESMLPTLRIGDRVLVDRVTPRLREWHVGDVVVVRPPLGAIGEGDACGVRPPDGSACPEAVDEQADTYFIKRIVALSGDRVSIRDGEVIRNGKPVDIEGAIVAPTCELCDFPRSITVPDDTVMLVGDNRGNSYDSRAWGPEPTEWIIGLTRAVYWPPTRLDSL